jgi:excisionase family DNA binding protein
MIREQVLFSLPLDHLEPIFKTWVRDVITEQSIVTQNQSSEAKDEILTIDQAAGFLNLTKPTIYSLVSRNELPVMKRSKRLYFSKQELINYLKQGRNKTNKEIEAEAKHFLNRKKY